MEKADFHCCFYWRTKVVKSRLRISCPNCKRGNSVHSHTWPHWEGWSSSFNTQYYHESQSYLSYGLHSGVTENLNTSLSTQSLLYVVWFLNDSLNCNAIKIKSRSCASQVAFVRINFCIWYTVKITRMKEITKTQNYFVKINITELHPSQTYLICLAFL